MSAAAGRRPDGALAANTLRRASVVGACAVGALVAWWCLEGGWSTARALLAGVLTAPLWLALVGLSRGRRRTYAWMTLALTPYMVLAIMEAVASPHARVWASACLFACFALFVLLISYLRATRPG